MLLCKILERNKTFKESSKSRGIFTTQARIYDVAFLWIYSTTYHFCNKSSIIDVWLGYILASKSIEMFKVKLSWSKSSQLLQRRAFSCFFWILSPIKMKFGQILVCCMTNISNMFLAECWRLETSSRLFYYFIKKGQYNMYHF